MGLTWAAQESPAFNAKTKASMKAILEKINDSDEIEKINKGELYNAVQAGVIEVSKTVHASELVSKKHLSQTNTDHDSTDLSSSDE